MSDSDRDARIAALEAAVAELRSEVAHARRPLLRSMRTTHRCPACNGGRLIHFRNIKDMGDGGKEPGNCRGARLPVVKPDGKDVVEIIAPAEPEPDAGPYR